MDITKEFDMDKYMKSYNYIFTDKFKQLLIDTDAYVSGSSILSCIKGTPYYKIDKKNTENYGYAYTLVDIDIYVHYKNSDKLINSFGTIVYVGEDGDEKDERMDIMNIKNIEPVWSPDIFSGNRNSNYSINPKSCIASSYDKSFFKKNNIIRNYTFELQITDNIIRSGRPTHLIYSIDVMLVDDTKKIEDVVSNFDLQCCQNWLRFKKGKLKKGFGIKRKSESIIPYSVYSTHHEQNILGQTELNKDYVNALHENNTFIKKRISKYQYRGFNITIPSSVMVDMDDYLKTFNHDCIIQHTDKDKFEKVTRNLYNDSNSNLRTIQDLFNRDNVLVPISELEPEIKKLLDKTIKSYFDKIGTYINTIGNYCDRRVISSLKLKDFFTSSFNHIIIFDTKRKLYVKPLNLIKYKNSNYVNNTLLSDDYQNNIIYLKKIFKNHVLDNLNTVDDYRVIYRVPPFIELPDDEYIDRMFYNIIYSLQSKLFNLFSVKIIKIYATNQLFKAAYNSERFKINDINLNKKYELGTLCNHPDCDNGIIDIELLLNKNNNKDVVFIDSNNNVIFVDEKEHLYKLLFDKDDSSIYYLCPEGFDGTQFVAYSRQLDKNNCYIKFQTTQGPLFLHYTDMLYVINSCDSLFLLREAITIERLISANLVTNTGDLSIVGNDLDATSGIHCGINNHRICRMSICSIPTIFENNDDEFEEEEEEINYTEEQQLKMIDDIIDDDQGNKLARIFMLPNVDHRYKMEGRTKLNQLSTS